MNTKIKGSIFLSIFILSGVTGVLTTLIIALYKFCAKYIITFSQKGYAYINGKLWLVPMVLFGLFLISCFFDYVYKKEPNLKGGGIPTAIAVIRGIVSFNWLKNLIGTFVLSLLSFFIGVPLGNEGPSVQMGADIGKVVISPFSKRRKELDYSVTGGACAGFAAATGAPVSGILFAVEEAHQAVSPMILIASSVSVMFGYFTSKLLSLLFNIEVSLFAEMNFISLALGDIWLPIAVGVLLGFFSVLFLKYYEILFRLFNKKLNKIPTKYKIFLIFSITLIMGLCSYSFVSTGHELILSIFKGNFSILMLAVLLLLRTSLTLSANSNGITGGMFVPLLAIGALSAGIIAKVAVYTFGFSNDYYVLILALGITACIAGMMRMPLTAIVFSIEAFGMYNNILTVIIVAALSYIITEIFGVESITESVLQNKSENKKHLTNK